MQILMSCRSVCLMSLLQPCGNHSWTWFIFPWKILVFVLLRKNHFLTVCWWLFQKKKIFSRNSWLLLAVIVCESWSISPFWGYNVEFSVKISVVSIFINFYRIKQFLWQLYFCMLWLLKKIFLLHALSW